MAALSPASPAPAPGEDRTAVGRNMSAKKRLQQVVSPESAGHLVITRRQAPYPAAEPGRPAGGWRKSARG